MSGWFSSSWSDLTAGLGIATSSAKGPDADAEGDDATECLREWGLELAAEDALVVQLRAALEAPVADGGLGLDLGPELGGDDSLRRFLRARKHSVPRARDMVAATAAWRARAGADTVLTDFVFHEKKQFHAAYPEGFFHTDRAGRPVYVQRPGDIDTAALWKFTTIERAVTYHISQQERYVGLITQAAGVAAGRPRMQSLVLLDMEGVGLSTLTGEVRRIMGEIMKIDQDYYPELMWRCVIVNAPAAFRAIWGAVRYLLDARTQAKVEVVPPDGGARLRQLIAPEKLLKRYGGAAPEELEDEPGPWRDPEVVAEVERRRAARAAAWRAARGRPAEPGDAAALAAAAAAAAAAGEQRPAAAAAGRDDGGHAVEGEDGELDVFFSTLEVQSTTSVFAETYEG